MPEPRSVRFVDEPVEVSFDSPPVYEKLPHCPAGFVFEGQIYRVVEMLSEWTDFSRGGHALRTVERGSLNVGRFFFRVRTDTGELFDLYYDRAMKSVDNRKGQWYLYRMLAET